VGFDGNAEACDALALGKLLADATLAELIVAAVYPGRDGGSSESRRDFFRRVFDRAVYELDGARFTRCEMVDSPARGLHMLAEVEGSELLVVGSTHRGRFGQVLPGSVGQQLLSGAPCPVAVAPRGLEEHPRLHVVGVAYDSGPESELALSYGVRLADLAAAAVRLITVGPRYGPLDLLFESSSEARDRLRERMWGGLAKVPPHIESEGIVREGDASSELIAASHEVDLLVIGSRSYGPVRAALLGGTSADLVRNAACATLVIPRGFDVEGALPGTGLRAAGELVAPPNA
jgi:nucleotide-binding universal stress UspA family protein